MIEQKQPKFKIETEPVSQIIRCRHFLVSGIIETIQTEIGSVANVDPEEDILQFCKSLNPNTKIEDLMDEGGDLSYVEVEWDALLNHLYSKFGTNIKIIPNMIIEEMDEADED